jgi:hypothetical protein
MKREETAMSAIMNTKMNTKEEAPGFEGIVYQGVSRRAFLLSGAGAALGVMFGAPLAGLGKAFAE